MAGDDSSAEDPFDAELDRHGLRPIDQGRSGWTAGRILAVLGVAAMAGFWIWAFSPLAPSTHPDELDSPAFADAARPRCAAAEEAIDALPIARTVSSMRERADLIDTGTAILRALVEDLAAIAPDGSTADGELVAQWLADYEIYLSDRDAYAQNFRDGIDEAFTVSTKGRDQITDPIDQFAGANRIIECATPDDV